MTYNETLEYLYQQLPMYSRIGAEAYKENLDNITVLCKELDDPQKFLKCIHIAGTNGKGSTSHMLASILQAAGYKTGLYTSPHIHNFGERIRINGQMIDPDFVIEFVEKTKTICGEIKPSFFELTVAMAFEYFAKQKTDIVIIETGLGGRLDSTNIITPMLSVITNIGFDHMDILGNTLPKIAEEKAGIIKKNIPVVIGETLKETRDVFVGKANKEDAAIHFADEQYIIEYIDLEGQLLLCNIKNLETNIVQKLRLDLSGAYQSKNARTVLCCIDVLRKNKMIITEEALHKGIESVKKSTGLFGRWEIIQNNPTVILDVAHNIDGITEVVNQLQNDHPGKETHFVLGFVKDKDIQGLLKIFPPDAHFYFTNAKIPRALPHTELKKLAEEAGLTGESYDDVNIALKAAVASGKDNVVVVCGSFFIISEVIRSADSAPDN